MCWMLVHWFDSCKTHELPSTKQTRQSDRLVRCLSCVVCTTDTTQMTVGRAYDRVHEIACNRVKISWREAIRRTHNLWTLRNLSERPNDRRLLYNVRCAHRAPSNMNIGESLCAFTFVSQHFTHSKWLNFEMDILHLIAWALKMFH